MLLFAALSQQALSQTPLDVYLQEGLKSNLALQQKHVSLERAVYALKVANSYFLPSLNFAAGYTHGNGGRSIALPVGDLLNPVYSTLNQLTESNNFPQIENVEQTFFPQNFYDAHVRVAMPLINTELYGNKRIHQDKVLLQEWELKAYERELVKNIKQAYYQYLGALEAVKILESALGLVEQNLEVNESLLRNGRGLPASVLRARSELETVKAQQYEAAYGVENARRYFNFLLNKPQDTPIETTAGLEAQVAAVPQLLLKTQEEVPSMREELQMLQTGERMTQTALRIKEQARLPRLNAFIDLGAQADNMQYNRDARYYLLGVSLDLPLFNGFRNRFETRQAQLEVKGAQLSLEQTRQQLQLTTANAQNGLATAHQNYTAAQQRLQASQAYFRLLERGYKEGSNSLIEFIDARNQYTNAQLQLTLDTYRVLGALAQYERETAAFPVHP